MAREDRRDERPELTEPEIVHCLWCTGAAVQVTEQFARIVGWVDLPVVDGTAPERRIVARLVMPNPTFRQLLAEGRRGLARGGH